MKIYEIIKETATAGATSAANVDGTVVNALDQNANLMTGGSIKRR
jgi:hypothetical protein